MFSLLFVDTFTLISATKFRVQRQAKKNPDIYTRSGFMSGNMILVRYKNSTIHAHLCCQELSALTLP